MQQYPVNLSKLPKYYTIQAPYHFYNSGNENISTVLNLQLMMPVKMFSLLLKITCTRVARSLYACRYAEYTVKFKHTVALIELFLI